MTKEFIEHGIQVIARSLELSWEESVELTQYLSQHPVMQEGKEEWSDIIQRNKSKLDRPEFDAMVYGVPVDSTSARSNPSQDLDTHSSNLL